MTPTEARALAEQGKQWRFAHFAPTGDTADLIDALATTIHSLCDEVERLHRIIEARGSRIVGLQEALVAAGLPTTIQEEPNHA